MQPRCWGMRHAGQRILAAFVPGWRSGVASTRLLTHPLSLSHCAACRVPHAAADELDELSLEVTAAGDAEDSEGPSAEQRRRAEAAARGLLPLLEPALEQLLERCRQK